MRYEPYPHYKDSGVEWLGKIPAVWEVKPLGRICSINPPKGQISELPWSVEVTFLPMEAIGDDGQVDLSETRVLDEVVQGYTHFRSDDIILAKITPCFENGKGALCRGLISGIGFGTTELHILRSHEETLPPFLFYVTKSHPFRNLGTASMQGAAGQKRVTESFLRNYPIALPLLSEQRAIAAFLDRETAKIDALVAKKERLIKLLQEKRTALITRAVTKGLDPNVPMKDSGVEWLGKIPAHWQVMRVKRLSEFVTSGSRGWAEFYTDSGSIFLRIGNLSPGAIDLDLGEIQYVSAPIGAEGDRTRVQPGDLLISITALIGAVGVIPNHLAEAYVNQHLALVRFRGSNINSRWVAYCVLSSIGQGQLHSELYGGTKDGLALEDIRSLFVLVPPLTEHQSIVDFLDRECMETNALIARVREGIERLKEYRTALISEAVTGKIDVRGQAA